MSPLNTCQVCISTKDISWHVPISDLKKLTVTPFYHLKSASNFHHSLNYLIFREESKHGSYSLFRGSDCFLFKPGCIWDGKDAINSLHQHNRCVIRTTPGKPRRSQLLSDFLVLNRSLLSHPISPMSQSLGLADCFLLVQSDLLLKKKVCPAIALAFMFDSHYFSLGAAARFHIFVWTSQIGIYCSWHYWESLAYNSLSHKPGIMAIMAVVSLG